MPGGYPLIGSICNATDVGTVSASSVGTSIASSGSAGVYSGYTQLTASSTTDACMMLVSIEGGSFASSNNVMVKIAIGAGGSEVDIISDLIFSNGTGANTAMYFKFPIAIPSGTRISAAVAPQNGGVDSVNVQVTLFDASFTQSEACAGVDAVGLVANAKGTTLTSGAANTKGSYSQLTASTSKDYVGFSFLLEPGNGGAGIPTSAALLDIAIGAAASEVIIVPNYLVWANNQPMSCLIGPFLNIPIPSGTRVAARWQNVVGAGPIGLTLYGVYK